MIDKGKLLKWIEERIDVYGPPYDYSSTERTESFQAKVHILNVLKTEIVMGELDGK